MFKAAEILGSIPARWPLNPSYMHTFGDNLKINYIKTNILYHYNFQV